LDDIPKGMIRWIKFTGLTDSSVLEKVSEDLHPLVMEDILNPFQRPKFEDYGEYIYIILKKMDFDQSSDEINFEQISLILGEHFVMSFEEQKSELFDTIVERIKVPKGRIRFMGPDYLMYALIDVVVDYYFIVL
jgi:magnesium transporter